MSLILEDGIESFSTDRLTAERMTLDHLDEICRLHNDPNVMLTLSPNALPLPDDITRKSVIEGVEHWETYSFGLWVFRQRETGAFIGRGGLKRYEIEGETVNGLAYAVLSEFWGRGYATEMAEASVRIGFERLGFEEVDSWTLPQNVNSQNVMRKLGFKYVRNFTYADLPHLYFRLTASDFYAAQ